MTGAEAHAVGQRHELSIAALRRLPYREYLQTAHWCRTRTLALGRAGHQCALCPSREKLNVHHRSYARLGFEQPEDLIVLCRDCHERHHKTIALNAIRATDHEPLKAPLVPASSLQQLKLL